MTFLLNLPILSPYEHGKLPFKTVFIQDYTAAIKVRLHTTINRADFVSWCMLYTYEGNKMHS